ncbi:MAG: 2TM domain-containing protein [Deltaproteobacteria bacterium]|nr:2TM domain-containing protein [Deltaproteobacteria bacterium]
MSDPPPPPKRRYTEEEAREILRRAIDRQHADDDKTEHDDLLAAAREVGIDPEHFGRAADEVLEERERTSVAPAVHDEIAQHRREQRQAFVYRAALYVVVVGALAALDYLTGGGWWVQWVALVGGVLLAIRAARLLRPETDIRRELDKRRRREQKERARKQREESHRHARRHKAERRAAEREERKQRKREQAEKAGRGERKSRAPAHAPDFERTVEEGVQTLLAEHARRVRRAAERARAGARSPDGESVRLGGEDRARVDEAEGEDAEVEIERRREAKRQGR